MHAPTEAAAAPPTRLTTFDFEAAFRSDYPRIAHAEDLAVEAFWRLWQTPLARGDNSGGWRYRTAVRVQIMQSAPFRMNTPPGFQFGRFMEMAFRVFGRPADEAKALGAKLEANPALVLHFPEREPVRDVLLQSGEGIIVGDLNSDDLICFFWSTPDRIYIVSAASVTEHPLVTLANSIR